MKLKHKEYVILHKSYNVKSKKRRIHKQIKTTKKEEIKERSVLLYIVHSFKRRQDKKK